MNGASPVGAGIHPLQPDLALANDFKASPGEVHVWRAALVCGDGPDGCDLAALSSDERLRASRFRFDTDRIRFVRARTALRSILGGYLDCQPADVRFGYLAGGKPHLDAAAHPGSRIEFNVAHSEDLALFAVTEGSAVGVDLERVRSVPEASELASRFFPVAELNLFRAATGKRDSETCFLRGWTRLEARLKAMGVGLAEGGTSRDPAADYPPWSVIDLKPAPDYVGALAVAGPGWRVCEYEWVRSSVCS